MHHATQEELQRKCATAGIDLAAIEPVDTIWHDGTLHEAVPADLHGSFDTLIASHVIEHVPDLIGFLVSARHLLAGNGSVVVAVPDRRYCFDYFKPATMTGDVLEAHAAQRSRHSLRTAWNHFAYSVLLDGGLACSSAPLRHIEFSDPLAAAATVHAAYRDGGIAPYVDYHAWHFTPASFALVILELGQIGLIDWHVASLDAPIGFEFFAALRRGVEPLNDTAVLQHRRMELLKQQMLETREQIEFALAGGSVQAISSDREPKGSLDGEPTVANEPHPTPTKPSVALTAIAEQFKSLGQVQRLVLSFWPSKK